MMNRWLASFLLFICFWNATISFGATQILHTDSVQPVSALANSDSQKQSSVEAATATTPDCDPANCQNENCQFHRCHIGHCYFLVRASNEFRFSKVILAFLLPEPDTLEGVYPPGLLKPPSLS